MGKWTYRILTITMIVAIAGAAIYWIWLQTNPKTMFGPWTDPDYPTGTGWLLYPNGREAVSGVITIQWNPNKTRGLDSDDKVWISWSHLPRGSSPTFQHEDWEGCFCQVDYTKHVITDSAPNNGTYQWNATQALEECNGETYPYYIKIVAGKYMDASNRFFNITG